VSHGTLIRLTDAWFSVDGPPTRWRRAGTVLPIAARPLNLVMGQVW